MKITIQDGSHEVAVVGLDGDLTLDCGEAVKAAVTDLVAGHRKAVVLDASHVRFIDSQGLELLIWVRDYCQLSLIPFRLAGLDENCAKILQITRLDNEFSCSAHVTDAVKSLA
jgi:anti-sigma B factor antagonist